jgi:hypothetical protein
VPGVRNDPGLEDLDPFTRVLAVIMQSGDRLLGLFWNALVRIDKRHEFVELSYAFGNGDAEFGCQAAHGVRQHRLVLDQQGSNPMQRQDALLLHVLGWNELSRRAERRPRRSPRHRPHRSSFPASRRV